MKLNIQLFASGTITFTADGHLQGKIEWSSTSNGSALNSSNVTATLYARVTSGTTTGKSWTGYVKIGDASGHNFNGFSSSKSISSSWVKIAEYTDTISHNNDGTKTITISGWVKGPSGTTLENKKSSGSSSVTLDTIPRATSIIGVSSGTTPYSPTISWKPDSTLFKYRVKYSYGNYSTTSPLISPNQTTRYDYSGLEIPINIFTGVSSSQIYAIATLYTYASDGTTPIGDADTAQFTVTLNSAVKPNVGITNLAEADATMISKNWGIYVQGKSKLSFKVSTSGAPLPAPNVTTTASANGQPFSFNGYTNKTFTTNALSTTGTNTITASATDSRNRTTNATSQTYNVVAYSTPTINTAQVQRCDANGNVDKNGQYCLITFNASISSCDNNNKAGAEYKVGYRVQNTGNYTYVPLGTNADSKSASGMLFTDGIKSASSSGTKVQFSDSTYDIQFYVKDSFTTTTRVQSLDAGFDLLNFNASGKAMAIGKVSEASSNEELLEVALPTTFNEYIKDELIVDSIRSKNMLNPKMSIVGAITSNSTSEATDGNAKSITSGWIPCKPNTSYTISGGNNRRRWQTKASNGTITFAGDGVDTITTNSSARSFRVFYYYGDDNLNPQSITDVQIEEGITATTFMPYQELNYFGVNFAKVKYYNLGGTAGVTINTGIPTNNPNGFAGLIIFMKGSDISLVPFGRRWWTNSSSYSPLLTSNSTLVKESTTSWTLTLTSTSTSGEKLLILYTDTL